MEKESVYIHYLIGDLENYVINNRNKIERLINSKQDISQKEVIFIFNRFSDSLRKTTNLIKLSQEIEDRDTLRTISILSSETIAWILFTFPVVEESIPIFTENLIVEEKHLLDALGELLLELDEFIENPEKLKNFSQYLYKMVNEVSMTFGHLEKIIEKGEIEN